MKETYGKVNAYILNLMGHYDNFSMNEYDLVHKINKRFHYKLRANEVYKLHIKPLIERHWLIEIKNNGEISYIRIGKISHVRAEGTLKDQFYGYPEDMWDYMAGYYSQDEVIREMWESDPVNFMTEKEELEYYTNLWEDHLKNQDA